MARISHAILMNHARLAILSIAPRILTTLSATSGGRPSPAPPGLLKRLDAAVMEVWTTNFAMHRLARAELAGEAGLGTPAAKRLLAVIRWTGQTVLRCASELGFSPTSRPRTSVGTTWRPGPATVRDDDGPQESIEEYLERGRALEASRGMPPSKRH